MVWEEPYEKQDGKLELAIPDPGFRVQLVDVLLDVGVGGVVSGQMRPSGLVARTAQSAHPDPTSRR